MKDFAAVDAEPAQTPARLRETADAIRALEIAALLVALARRVSAVRDRLAAEAAQRERVRSYFD